ncbi:MAG: riboflavin synthase subunit alpha [Candidatus Poseidoniales archaeon]|nr:MAG: riboflavin synthase subunit alpha [Candidatus Poseidoniales archaeon]
MFTGLVEGRGRVESFDAADGFWRLVVTVPDADGLELGASVAIDGVCLTAVAIDGLSVAFDVIAETMQRSTLGDRNVGDDVNVERALRFGDEVGGHLVSGHVFDTGRIETVAYSGDACDLRVEATEATMRYIFEKGYIAISGISLTVGMCDNEGFHLHLIPETLARTTLGSAKVGDRVNLEVDPITVAAVETVERIKAQETLQ